MSVYIEKTQILEWVKLIRSAINDQSTVNFQLIHLALDKMEDILNH